ncbi:MAG: dicarboxylate/amino acid:cation symporter [Rickettsiaceae bacterium]|nr:dicarboxylate/amino acid:cation symporter [Rickettsiaceae bacterium]MDP4832746.1 dicarboxylate/amino acid:cation symporter [Rickettsiaceae bacterium]MDP5020866.1 dicarboxylate/amino acid:cation symporter [Rickettsiaceae bacterium]MDP5082969.1 dicarboxylate/amino acid:cation symporter [Rickettsiaceae bacterium]
MPAKLIFIILSVFLLGDFLPEYLKSLLLTTSLVMKEILLFILPAIVFFLVFASFSQLSGGFMVFTGLLLALVCISNFTAVMVAYPVGYFAQDFIVTNNSVQSSLELQSFYTLNLPKLCDNSMALVIGLLLGVYTSAKNNKFLKRFALIGSDIANGFLAKCFTPVLPIFILGFILKAQHDGLLTVLFRNFMPLLSVIIFLYVVYIGTLYVIVNVFDISRVFSSLKNILPAALVGFSSMSSAVAMPVLINGALKNCEDQDIPKRIVPFITNTHMMGDALAIPLMAISLYILEYNQFPTMDKYVLFAVAYMLAKFASAGIPGGTILIMTPVLEAKLGFTSEMSTIILTTYLLFDPFCTLGSVFGNGGFVMMFEKLKARMVSEVVV